MARSANGKSKTTSASSNAGSKSGTGGGNFLGPTDFIGSFSPPRKPQPTTGGQSTFDGAVIFFNLSRSNVAKVIPKELQLASLKQGRPDVHPVIIILSNQANLRYLLPNLPDPPRDNPYEELILMIPFVLHKQSSELQWHSFVVRMYLDDDWAIHLGNVFYGYAKQRGRFDRYDIELAPSTFKCSVTRKPYFTADLDHNGHWRSNDNAATTLPNYNAMQTIISMPLLGRLQYGGGRLGYVRSYFRWDCSTTFVRPMKSGHKFLEPFVGNMDSWVTRKPISSVHDGAFALRGLRWRLKWPPDGMTRLQSQAADKEWHRLIR